MARKLFGSGDVSSKSGSDVSVAVSRRLSTDEDDYKFLKIIGHGTFGLSVLWAVEYKHNGDVVMLRKIDLDSLSAEDLKSLEFEMWLSSQLRHTGVLQFLSSFVNRNMLLTTYPLYDFGSCYDVLQAGFPNGMPELAIAFILSEMLHGLDYLHKMTYVHRAVKASHILVSSDGRICLTGLRYCEKTEYDSEKGLITHSFPKHTLAILPWIAPEILHQNLLGYNSKADMYSVGITALELHTASVPFCGLQPTQILLHKLNGTVPEFNVEDQEGSDCLRAAHVASGFSVESLNMLSPAGKQQHMTRGRKQSSPFQQFVDALLKHSPGDRPSASTLQSHSFFKQLKRKIKDTSILELLNPLNPIGDFHGNQDSQNCPSGDIITKNIEKLRLNDDWIM